MSTTISKHRCLRCIVYGKVQGVFFRASARKQAQQLGLVGYAKNITDGSVEVVMKGNISDVERFKDWLHIGPESARVDNLECQTILDQEFTTFSVL